MQNLIEQPEEPSLSKYKKSAKRIDLKAILNPTFSVPLKGTRQRMPLYELILRQDIAKALQTKDPKAICDLIKLFIEHKVIEPDRSTQMSGIIRYPWYYDPADFHAALDENWSNGGKIPRSRKIKLIEPRTDAGRREMEERESIKGKRRPHGKKADGVSYKKPPIENQFKKGISGNPKGRPSAAKNRRAVVTRVANDKLEMKENGYVRVLQTHEALLIALRNLAIQGKGVKYLTDIIKKLLPEEPDVVTRPLVISDIPPHEEFLAMCEELRTIAAEAIAKAREEDEREAEPYKQSPTY